MTGAPSLRGPATVSTSTGPQAILLSRGCVLPAPLSSVASWLVGLDSLPPQAGHTAVEGPGYQRPAGPQGRHSALPEIEAAATQGAPQVLRAGAADFSAGEQHCTCPGPLPAPLQWPLIQGPYGMPGSYREEPRALDAVSQVEPEPLGLSGSHQARAAGPGDRTAL